ncbi:MAG TPA: sigma 54-interacting transcriptional regulator [Thermoanaerobaculia bacterium]
MSLQNFCWPRAAMATLRHPTLPWFEQFARVVSLNATPLADVRSLGARDRLSLTGQFAAHIAVLQFAGVADSDFDPAEWAVVRKRGSDCRLVRTAARPGGDAPTPLENIQELARFVDAPQLEVLRQSWTRAETVFAEVYRRLRSDATADLQWTRRCAIAQILSPGAAALQAMWSGEGPHFADDVDAFAACAALDDSASLAVIGSEFPIQRYAALAALDPSVVGAELSPAAVADRLLERFSSKRHVIVVSGNLDDDSAHVVGILGNGRETAEVAPRRWLVLSTRMAAQRAIEDRLTAIPNPGAWLDEFTASDAYDDFLHCGALPVDDGSFAATPEPRRSFIAALALLGTVIPRRLAGDFLRQFLFDHALDELVIHDITSVDDQYFRFASEAVREHCARHIPEASRPALCRAAASVADPLRAVLLLLEIGETSEAIDRLGTFQPSSAEETVRTLSRVPRQLLTAPLARMLGNAYVDAGRYRDAREVAPLLVEDDRELLLARCERRTGEYAPALARLERVSTPSFNASILRAELLRLTGRVHESREVLASADAQNDEQTMRLAYERAVLALDSDESVDADRLPQNHYFAKRFATYEALTRGDFETAERFAAESVEAARCATERIDGCLDRVFASFSTGHWGETRAIALEALAIVDEAQGDRAAAGVLFTLTFVEIDDARWSPASQRIRRLRDYYAHDELRLAEVDLLSGYLEFARARFDEARRTIESLLGRGDLLPQIREAAALIVDEIDWIQQQRTPLRSTGRSCNRELDDRHRLMRMRRGLASEPIEDEFLSQLAQWTPQSEAPRASARSEKLKLLRSALAAGRRDVAEDIAEELSIQLPEAAPALPALDLEILRTAAVAEYPFRASTFPIAWCHATRNRLGQWAQDGSRSFDAAAFDRIATSLEPDWLRCSDRELLFLEGSHAWPETSRDAIGSLFRTRAENHRLRRIVEQEEAPAAAHDDRVDGMVGESAAMRSVFALIERIGPRDVAVCVLGESGTGKELVGRAIHRASLRRHKPFTAINCAALPDSLVESELFGHMRGAFTGADRDRAGVIETTDGGTLFLDEIGEMPLAAQAKLLRFLQDGEFRRVGDTLNRTADVRIVSATNRKLEAAVEEGRFREDLYYRIRGVDIALPPLRERGGDVMLIAQHFLARERARHRSGPQSFTSEVEMLLQSYNWPGNVREVQNAIRAAHAMAGEAHEIDIEHLPERLRNVQPARVTIGSYQDAVARFRRELIVKSLLEAAGNQNRAAALLKISRQALAYQIRELGIMVGKPSPRARV